MSKTPSIDAVARTLGMKPSELISVDETEAGLLVEFTDGTAMVNVPDDNPDAEGKTGWMLFRVPAMKDGKTYRGIGPVYALRGGAVEATDGDDGYPPDGNIKAVLAWVAGDEERAQEALDVEVDGKGRASLIEELEAILAQYATGDDNGGDSASTAS